MGEDQSPRCEIPVSTLEDYLTQAPPTEPSSVSPPPWLPQSPDTLVPDDLSSPISVEERSKLSGRDFRLSQVPVQMGSRTIYRGTRAQVRWCYRPSTPFAVLIKESQPVGRKAIPSSFSRGEMLTYQTTGDPSPCNQQFIRFMQQF